MCAKTLNMHEKFINFANRLQIFGNRHPIMYYSMASPLSKECHIKCAKYIGCDNIRFYLLVTSSDGVEGSLRTLTSNPEKYLLYIIPLDQVDSDVCQLKQKQGFGFKQLSWKLSHFIKVIDVLIMNEEKTRTIIICNTTYTTIYYEFKNMMVSGFKYSHDGESMQNFFCKRDGKEIYSFSSYEHEDGFTVNTFSPEMLRVTYTNNMEIDITVTKIYELLLNTFTKSLEAIENDTIFISKLMNCMEKIFALTIGKIDSELKLCRFIKDMTNIILWRESILVKDIKNMLVNELSFAHESPRMKSGLRHVISDASLPVLVLRAMVYEHTLFLYRKATQ